MRNFFGKAVVMLLGIFALVVGIVSLKQRKSFVPTQATIVRIEQDLSTGSDPSYTVFVDYTVGDTEYRDAQMDYYKPSFKVGQTIEIRYNPDKPAQFTGMDRGFGIYLVIIGPVLILAGLIILLRRR